jgi:hypothetical protein
MRLPAFAFLVSCKDESPRTTTRAEEALPGKAAQATTASIPAPGSTF